MAIHSGFHFVTEFVAAASFYERLDRGESQLGIVRRSLFNGWSFL